MSEIISSLFCSTPSKNMGFWTILGNIAAQIAIKTADAYFNRGGHDKETPPAAHTVAQPNWTDVVGACDGIYNRGVPPIDAIGNMRQSLSEQDPKVLKLALKVLESVIEERGIPASNDREAAQFLRDMRELLRDTRNRDVMDGVFELNEAWSRACRNNPEFRGVGDLVEMLNSEGYKVLVTRDNDRRVINENAEATHCNTCDFQIHFDQLKHFCQYCTKIFCSSCCSYQRGIPPFQENSSVCICHECKAKNNCNFSSQQAAFDTQTTPKVYNYIPNLSPERSGLDNSDSKKIVTKFSVETKNKNLLSEHERYETRQEEEEGATCRLNNTKAESEDEDLKLALERSKESQMEDRQVRRALVISQWESENKESKRKGIVEFEVCSSRHSKKQNSRYQENWGKPRQGNAKYKENESDEDDENFHIAVRRSSQESSRAKERSASESENDDEDSEEGNTYSKEPTCCSKHGEDNWEEEEALQRALKLSLDEVKQACYNCGKQECQCNEEDVVSRAKENSLLESASTQLRPGDSNTTNLVLGKESEVESTGKPPKEEELRQKRLKYFEQENEKEHLESLGLCSKQDGEFSGRCEMLHEEECQLSDAARQKIAIVEEEEMKLAIQLSLQEMKKMEDNSNEESEDELNSSAEGDSVSWNSDRIMSINHRTFTKN